MENGKQKPPTDLERIQKSYTSGSQSTCPILTQLQHARTPRRSLLASRALRPGGGSMPKPRADDNSSDAHGAKGPMVCMVSARPMRELGGI